MKGVLLHGGLALLGLGLAYQTWARKPDEEVEPAQSVAVAECAVEALEALEMETPTHLIEVAPRKGGKDGGYGSHGDGTAYWITTRRKASGEQRTGAAGAGAAGAAGAASAPEAAVKAAADKPVIDPTVPKSFLANAAFAEYLRSVTPLRAVRALGVLPKGKLADFGFDKVGTRITLACAGKRVTLEVGARTYGTAQRYLRDAKSQVAYLFPEAFVADLQSAEFKFTQSELHAWKLTDVDEAVVSARGTRKRLVHRERKLPDRALWVDAVEPQKRNEAYGNWFSRLAKLRVREYLAQGAAPGADLGATGSAAPVTPVLTIEYATEGKPKGKLELVRIDEGGAGRYYARTETTRGWVSLYDSSVKEVESDVGLVLGVSDAAAPLQGAEPAPASR